MGQQKILEVLHNSKASSFMVTKINRSKLYGSKQRIPVDAQGQECSRAALTRDGMYILPVGATAILYLDEHGDVAERNQLRAIEAERDLIAPENSVPDTLPEVVQIATVAEILECGITHAYALEPVFISAELEKALFQGTIYRLPECNGRQAFLLGNDVGYFLLVGKRTGFEFIGLAEADLSPPDIDIDDGEDDLDFGMLL